MDLFARIVNGFTLKLVTIVKNGSTVKVWRAMHVPYLTCSNAGHCFAIHDKFVFTSSVCKHHQNILCVLVFLMILGFHLTFSLFYIFNWKFTDLMFFSFNKVKCSCPSTPDWHWACNFCRPELRCCFQSLWVCLTTHISNMTGQIQNF